MIETSCDGSGKLPHICSTLIPHKHCTGPEVVTDKFVGYDEKNRPLYLTVGNCLEPYFDDEDGMSGMCPTCRKELAGEPTHLAETFIRESRDPFGESSPSSGRGGHSPFKQPTGIYQWGDYEAVNQMEQTRQRYNARRRGQLDVDAESGAAD